MKKIFITLLFVITITCLLSGCWIKQKKEEIKINKNYSTYIVKTWNINNTETIIWYTSWVKEVMLSAKTHWRIIYLSKNVWDNVKKNELIASLDWAEAKTGYNTADNILNSLYELKEQTKNTYDDQINSIEAKIQQVQIWIKWVSTGLEDTKKITQKQLETAKSWIEQAKLWVETAQKNLEETKKSLETNKKNILDWWKTAITQNFILSKNIIKFSDKLLWFTIENEMFNDEFEDFLWVKDSIHFNKTKWIFEITKKDFDKYENFYNEKIDKKEIVTEEDIIKWLRIALNYSEKQKQLLKELYKVLDNSVDSVYFTVPMIQEYQKNISQMWSDLESSLLTAQWNYILWIKWTLQNLDTLKTDWNKWISLLEKQVELAKASLLTAEKTYLQYEAMSKWEVNWVITKKEIAESQLKEVYVQLKSIEAQKQASLKEIDAKIAEAKWWKSSASVMINNWKVYSSISWIVTMKMTETWQVINAWMPIYKVVDTSRLKVKASVPNDIFKNLKINQKIDLIVEWFNESINWKVTSLNKQANKITKKYDVEIIINNYKRKIPIWAMSLINFKQSNNSIESLKPIIPNEAIISKFGLPSVYVLKDWKAVLKNIKIIKMWETKSEVSWIKSLDKIIVTGKENIFDWEILEEK